MSAGQEFWIVAAGGGDVNYLQNLKSRGIFGAPTNFNVPDLKFGSFDNLVRLTDDLQKNDGQVDTILHRLERQYLELDPNAVFKVRTRREEKDFSQYANTFQWDEGMFSKERTIGDNLEGLMKKISKIDEEARNKTAQYNELKSQRGAVAKKDAANLLTKELVDVLTPGVVVEKGSAEDDFIYTDHLTTVCVVLPRGAEKDFLKCYERLAKGVVPQSARQFTQVTDKDKNTVWRVVLFKSGADEFRRACREKKFLPREFTYDKKAYEALQRNRDEAEKAVNQQHQVVTALYKAAWSDTAVAWMHVKAMRVFVESVLRFGSKAKFQAFVLSPKASATAAARKALAEILSKGSRSFGDEKAGQDDDEEFYPYVSLSFVPFGVQG